MTALSISISVMSLVYTILSACECYVYIIIHLFGIKVFNLIHFKNVTDFWKTNQIVTLGLFHLLAKLIATLMHYPFTEPLTGSTDWSAFLEQALPTM